MNLVAPALAASSQTRPIPRSLNDPAGCMFSILRNTLRPEILLRGTDSRRGVSLWSAMVTAS